MISDIMGKTQRVFGNRVLRRIRIFGTRRE
jgi:hypothetical protein